MPDFTSQDMMINNANINRWRRDYNRSAASAFVNTYGAAQALLLRARIADGEEFLTSLQSSADQLVDDFSQLIKKNILHFETKFPSNQTLIVRKACYYLNEVTNPPINAVATYRLTTAEINRKARQRYHSLCQSLWLFYDEMKDQQVNNGDAQFRSMLVDSINKSHVPLHGNFPDNHKIGYTITDSITTLKPLSDDAFLQLELSEYKKEFDLLQSFQISLAAGNSPFRDTQASAVAELLKEVHTENTSPNFDYKFAITVLKNTRKLIAEPADLTLYQNYIALATQLQHQAKRGNVFYGFLCRALACIAVCASLSFCFLALVVPVVTPVAIGFNLGAAGCLAALGMFMMHLSDKSLREGPAKVALSANIEMVAQQFTHRRPSP